MITKKVCAECGANVSITNTETETGSTITECKCTKCKCTATVDVLVDGIETHPVIEQPAITEKHTETKLEAKKAGKKVKPDSEVRVS